MCPNFRNGGLQLIMWTSRVERRGDCLLRPRDCHFIFLACVSKPKYETDWRQKNVLETQIFGVGATSYDSFFGAGRLFINTSFFIRPPPTLFLHPPSLSISLSSSHPLPPFIHSSYSMPPKADPLVVPELAEAVLHLEQVAIVVVLRRNGRRGR